MHPAHIIAKKRDGLALDREEIATFVDGYVDGSIPDYQMAALAMAICLRGMNADETTALTHEMLHSGTTLSWQTDAPIVDKHSSGGVGDKTSLILAPLLACCGLQVPMISGRGLGATGGTLDKLESIPGFRTDLSINEMQRIVERVGCVITGATPQIAPADKKLYALRDVTATVESIPLITASIMSKKLAEGLDALVLDVKFGSGEFMKTLDAARGLANSLVAVGTQMGVQTTALLTDMNQPLGRTAGGSVEVDESIEVLSGRGPADLVELTIDLAAELLITTNIASEMELARERLRGLLNDGEALEKFREMVTAQGGDLNAPRPVAPRHPITAGQGGTIQSIDTGQLGLAIVQLGGGRKKTIDSVDPAVGLEMHVRVGDQVDAGDVLVELFAPPEGFARVRSSILQSIAIDHTPASPTTLIVERIEKPG